MKHYFGGLWTREKLNILEKYLAFYTRALKDQPFTLHYVDAFAGTGRQNPKINGMQEDFLPEEDFDGSVRIALDVEPGFDQYHFNDLNPLHKQAIERIAKGYPRKVIHVTQADANQFVPKFCESLTSSDRAILFLDPCSTELDWNTLLYVANSQKIDLWLLFPLSVILRMTPVDGDDIKPEWKNTLNRLLGTSEWEDALYRPKERPLMEDLFGHDVDVTVERLNVDELKKWITQRMGEIFSYVAEPVLLTNNNRPLFLFCFAVSNSSPNAWRLADRVVKHITKR